MISTYALKSIAFALVMLPLAAEAASKTRSHIILAQTVEPARKAPPRNDPAQATPAPASDNLAAAEAPQPNPYCEAVADAASDARFAWQAKTLEAMRLDIEERAARLEEKRAETELWLTRRQDFLNKAEDRIVSIYSRMRADAAAAQIAAMQDDAAVALLSKIDARAASAIFNEMEPVRAAHLTSVITGVLKRTAQNKARPK